MLRESRDFIVVVIGSPNSCIVDVIAETLAVDSSHVSNAAAFSIAHIGEVRLKHELDLPLHVLQLELPALLFSLLLLLMVVILLHGLLLSHFSQE